LKKRRLLVLDAKTRKHFRSSPADLTIERDFNRIDAQGVDPGALESAYAKSESQIAEAIVRTTAAKNFTSKDDCVVIANFVALLLIRSPWMRSQIARFTEDTLKLVTQVMTSNEDRWNAQRRKMKEKGYLDGIADVSFQDLKKFVREDQYDVRMPREFYIRQELMLLQKLPQIVAQRNWIILLASESSGGFITSDHPACLMWSDPKMRAGFYGPGLGLAGTQITFPLSPQVAIVGAFEFEPAVYEVGPQPVAEFNGATISNAVRQVYSRGPEAIYVMNKDEKPKACMELLSDQRFKATPRPKLPWY